jgi:hypothetical protein
MSICIARGCSSWRIKSHSDKIANRHTESWEQGGRVITIDSPLILANSKEHKLGDLLERQKAFKEIKRPYVEAHVRGSYK